MRQQHRLEGLCGFPHCLRTRAATAEEFGVQAQCPPEEKSCQGLRQLQSAQQRLTV